MAETQQVVNEDDVFLIHQARISDAVGAIQRKLAANDITDCEECGDPIDERRKIALPSAKHCVYCAGILEKKR